MNGELKLSVNNYGNYYGINCDIKINDGQLHTLTIMKMSNKISMQIDKNEEIQQVFSEELQDINLIENAAPAEKNSSKFNLFLGGRIREFHAGKSGFRGCLYQLIIDNKEIDFETNPVNTANPFNIREGPIFKKIESPDDHPTQPSEEKYSEGCTSNNVEKSTEGKNR